MNALEHAVFDLVGHNMKEPDAKVDFEAWVDWSMKQTELIEAVKVAERETYPSKIGDEF